MNDPSDTDDGPRDANGDRLAVDEDKRMGSGTLADILAVTAARAAAQAAHETRRAAEAEAHRAGCRAEECRTCERVKCYRCGAVKQGLGGMCEACRDLEKFERAKERVFASIPKRFRWAIDAELSTLTERVKLSAGTISSALSWATNIGIVPPNLALSGVTGAGKTSLCVALFARWFAKHRSEDVRFATAIELGLARMRYGLGKDDPPAITEAIGAPLLILDDLGAEAPMHADVLRQVLHARHNEDIPTWVTTGLTQAEFARRYDGGLARRVFEEAKQVSLGVKS